MKETKKKLEINNNQTQSCNSGHPDSRQESAKELINNLMDIQKYSVDTY